MTYSVIFLSKETKVHPRIIGKNLVDKYEFPEGYYLISNKEAYLYDKSWDKVV